MHRRLGRRVGSCHRHGGQAVEADPPHAMAGRDRRRDFRSDRNPAAAAAVGARGPRAPVVRDRMAEAAMIQPVLFELALQFLLLSLLSIGGANAVIPEMHLRAVEIEHWMSDADFSQLFA